MANQIRIDYDQLAQRCRMPESEFFNIGQVVNVTPASRRKNEDDIPESFYIFKDNGTNILAVAHLDSVITPQENWTFEKARLGKNGEKLTHLWNPQLDDRLGAYIILDLLPSILGEGKYDILLTTDEEIGASTAQYFEPPEGRQYNWIFQFDRRGTGAVLYEYDDADWRAVVNEFLLVQTGSFSDICMLNGLNAKALNVGTGYHDEHRHLCYAIMEEVIQQVRKFLKFFNVNKDEHFPHVKSARRTYRSYGWDDGDNGNYYYYNSTVGTKPSTSATNLLPFRTNTPKVDADPREWTEQPNVSIFRMKLQGGDHSWLLFCNPVTGRQACECTLCLEMDYIETMYWTDVGLPLCEWCYQKNVIEMNNISDTQPMELLESIEQLTEMHSLDQIEWVQEGGAIRKVGQNWIRCLPKNFMLKTSPLRQTIHCAECKQPDWFDKAERESDDSVRKTYLCRWCVIQEMANQLFLPVGTIISITPSPDDTQPFPTLTEGDDIPKPEDWSDIPYGDGFGGFGL